MYAPAESLNVLPKAEQESPETSQVDLRDAIDIMGALKKIEEQMRNCYCYKICE